MNQAYSLEPQIYSYPPTYGLYQNIVPTIPPKEKTCDEPLKNKQRLGIKNEI